MQSLLPNETAALERIEHDPVLAQVQTWSAVNSGSGNLAGLATTAGLLADSFAALPGEVELVSPTPVERVRGSSQQNDGVCQVIARVLTVSGTHPLRFRCELRSVTGK